MIPIVNPRTPHDRVVEPFTLHFPYLHIDQTLDPPGLRIEGELDLSTQPALIWALKAIDGEVDIRLDLAALTFIDVGCLRVLVATATRQEDGHVLTLWAPSPQLRRLLEISGWHRVAELRLQDAPLPALTVSPLRRLGKMFGLRQPRALA